jgi:hypothetical protein
LTLDTTTLTSFNRLFPKFIDKFETLSVDQQQTVTDKINSLVDAINSMYSINNQIIKQWNDVMQWALNDGLQQNVQNSFNSAVSAGTFDTLFNTVMGDKTTLLTADKDTVVHAINDLVNIVGALTSLTTSDKTSIVNAINALVTSDSGKLTKSQADGYYSAIGALTKALADTYYTPIAKGIQAQGQKMEIVTLTFTPSGSGASVASNSPAFVNTYTSIKAVVPCQHGGTVPSYGNALDHPYITALTTTGFTATLTANGGNIAAGTFTMAFLVIGV